MEFIKNHILLIATILAFIIFAIIGYVVDKTKNQSKKEKEILNEEVQGDFVQNIETPTKKTSEESNIKKENSEEKNINLNNL